LRLGYCRWRLQYPESSGAAYKARIWVGRAEKVPPERLDMERGAAATT